MHGGYMQRGAEHHRACIVGEEGSAAGDVAVHQRHQRGAQVAKGTPLAPCGQALASFGPAQQACCWGRAMVVANVRISYS